MKNEFLEEVICTLKLDYGLKDKMFILKDYDKKLEQLLYRVKRYNDFNSEMVEEACDILTKVNNEK